MKSRAPQLHLEYRFYKQLGQAGMIYMANKNMLVIDTVISSLEKILLKKLKCSFFREKTLVSMKIEKNMYPNVLLKHTGTCTLL